MSIKHKPRKHRHKREYTVMVVSGDSDGRSRTFHLGHGTVQFFAFLLFALILVIVCYVIYTTMAMSSLNSVIGLQTARIDELVGEIDKKKVENESLQDEIKQLSRAITQKMENEAALVAADEEKHLPTGVPFDGGKASVINTFDDPDSTAVPGAEEPAENGEEAASGTKGDPIIVFKAESGSLVTSSGDGTVESVNADSKFGNSVVIDHGNGYVSIYRNAGTSLVRPGDEVHRGDILFVIGDDNLTLGYQLKNDGKFVDPEDMIDING